jgi:hypothetical protein
MLDHWAYLSAVGVWIWIATGLENLTASGTAPRLAPVAFPLLCAYWMILGWINISRRDTEKELYLWSLRFPTSSVVRANLGLLLYEEGDFAGAARLLRETIAMNPNDRGAANVLALSLWRSGDAAGGNEILNALLEKDPEHIQSRLNRALISGGKTCREDVEFVLSRDPGNESALRVRKICGQ